MKLRRDGIAVRTVKGFVRRKGSEVDEVSYERFLLEKRPHDGVLIIEAEDFRLVLDLDQIVNFLTDLEMKEAV